MTLSSKPFTLRDAAAAPPGAPRKDSLRSRLLEGVDIQNRAQSKKTFEDGANDFRWAETMRGEDSPTGRDTIAINFDKFEQAGAKDFRGKMVLGESLHRLKDVEPDRYDRLRSAALNDPEYMMWARRSYAHEQKNNNERRPFMRWHDVSRFDQVIGGYLLGGDPSIPSMREWDRSTLPIGPIFRRELDSLERELK